MARRRARACALALAAVLLAGCTGAADPGAPATSTQGRTPGPDGPGAVTVGTPTAAARTRRRPVAVPVAPDGPAATLAGLDAVTAVVEYPRGGRTALLAVSRGDDGPIGPVRPPTRTDVALAVAEAADLATTVAGAGVVAELQARGLGLAEEGRPPGAVLRDPARPAPFNAYAVPATVRDELPAPTPRPTRPLPRGPAPAGGAPVAEVTVAAARDVAVTWTWDARAGSWLRSTRGTLPQLADGRRVAAGTVAVLEVSGPPWVDVGAGPAVVLRGGRRWAGRWRSDAADRPPAVELRDGTPMPVDGTVWLTLCAPGCAQQISPPAGPVARSASEPPR